MFFSREEAAILVGSAGCSPYKTFMNQGMHSPLYVTQDLLQNRYPGAETIFVAGSVVKGEATAHSDLDLVVVYKQVPRAFRESFSHRGWPVEAFIHDPETLHYFFNQVDRPIGRGTLAEMIAEGHEVPGPSEFSQSVKALAKETLRLGTPPLTDEELQDRRYQLSEMLDDIREPRTRQDLVAGGTLLYNELAEFYFRTRCRWTASGKAIVKRMKMEDPALARKFAEAFDLLFATGKQRAVIELAEELMASHGGVLFEGYRREVPADWRTKL